MGSLIVSFSESLVINYAFHAVGARGIDGVQLFPDRGWGASSREAAQKLHDRIGGMSKYHVGKLNKAFMTLGYYQVGDEPGHDLVKGALARLAKAVSEKEVANTPHASSGTTSSDLPVELL
jgi:hypothetical protein